MILSNQGYTEMNALQKQIQEFKEQQAARELQSAQLAETARKLNMARAEERSKKIEENAEANKAKAMAQYEQMKRNMGLI